MPTARTGDISTAWFEIGRGSPIVLIHGLADDHRLWRKLVPSLAIRHRMLLYDLRGHGQTSLGDADGSLRQLGQDLLNLLDALELETAALAGYSLGGTVAMRLAIDHPERVEVLFPVATSSRVGKAALPWYEERAAAREQELRQLIDRDTVDQYHIAPGELEDALLMRREATTDLGGYRNASQAMARLNEEPLDPELAKITTPTLVVSADLDQHCPPRAGEIIAQAIPGASLEIITGSGHPIPLEQPDQLAGLIESFLRESLPA